VPFASAQREGLIARNTTGRAVSELAADAKRQRRHQGTTEPSRSSRSARRLTAYGVVAAFQPSHEFGRVLAAYGGVLIVGSLLWGVALTAFSATAPTSSARSSA
jgi:hypothetical protein